MTTIEDVPAIAKGRSVISIAVPALISIASFLVLTAVVSWGWGQPDRFGSDDVYRGVMDAAVLLRLGPAFLSGIIVYPAMRFRGASITWAVIGTLSSALVFGIVGAIQALTFFPALQAAYYVFNPMVIASLGAQVGWVALGEMFVRWRRQGIAGWTPRLLAVVLVSVVVGFGFFYVGVIWDGGRHWFYVWIRGYMWLFGTGQ